MPDPFRQYDQWKTASPYDDYAEECPCTDNHIDIPGSANGCDCDCHKEPMKDGYPQPEPDYVDPDTLPFE